MEREDQKNDSIIVYSTRWRMLFLYCSLALANAMLFATYSSISNITQNYFIGSSYNNPTAINMFNSVFLMLYPIGSVIGVLSLQYGNMRSTMLLAGTLTTIGALLRYLATLGKGHMSLNSIYIIMLLGQTIAALAYPIIQNLPTTLASTWFPVMERDISTTLGSLFFPVGNAVGAVLPSLMVIQHQPDGVDDDDHDSVGGMADLMLTEFIICLIILMLAVILFQSAPPTPPSVSTQLKDHRNKLSGRESERLLDDDGFALSDDHDVVNKNISWSEYFQQVWGAVSTILKTCIRLLSDREYFILFSAFSLSLGVLNAFIIMINQLLEPHGYSNTDAGTLAAVAIFAGLIGSGIFGYYMGESKAYISLLRFCGTMSVITCWLCLASLGFNSFPALLVAGGIYSFFSLPLLPIMLETCAECCYPLPEQLSVGLMQNGANGLAAAFVFIIQVLLEQPDVGPSPLLPSSLFIAGITTIMGMLVWLFSGKYKRLQYDIHNSNKNDRSISNPIEQESIKGLLSPVITQSNGTVI